MIKTQFEADFFRIAEKFHFEFDDDGNHSFDRIEIELFNITEKFQEEIIENCTSLNTDDRIFYIERIINRLDKIPLFIV